MQAVHCMQYPVVQTVMTGLADLGDGQACALEKYPLNGPNLEGQG